MTSTTTSRSGCAGRRSPTRRKKRVTEMLELVELPGYEGRKPGQISGGQAQRVALARALVNKPAVLLLDEPLGALDLKLRKQMQVELKRIQQEVGITFVYVTHDQEEAMTMADSIAVMNHGARAVGGPELYERPRRASSPASWASATALREGRRPSMGTRPSPRGRQRLPGAGRACTGRKGQMPWACAGEDPPDRARQGHPGRVEPPDRRDRPRVVPRREHPYIVQLPDGNRVTVFEQNASAPEGRIWATGEAVVLSWQHDHRSS